MFNAVYNFHGINGFEWDTFNTNKSKLKHNVDYDEAEEVFYNLPILLFEDRKHSVIEKRFICIGTTNNNRLLFISFTTRANKIRIISARPANKQERTLYEHSQKI